MLRLLILASLVGPPQAETPRPAVAPGLEARVLDVLMRFAADAPVVTWYAGVDYAESTPTSPALAPLRTAQPQIDCGNSHQGSFDDLRARLLARGLFEAYGLRPQRDLPVEVAGGRALLDGFDPLSSTGFKLRGRGSRSMGSSAAPEHADTDLSDAEVAALRAQGWVLHIADVADFALFDGDELMPALAYAESLARFLNARTRGEDINLGGLLFERSTYLRCEGDQLLAALGLSGPLPETWTGPFTLAEPTTLALAFDPHKGSALDPAVEARLSAVQRAQLLELRPAFPAVPSKSPGVFVMRLARTDGKPADALLRFHQDTAPGQIASFESRAFPVFVPSSVDLSQPFRLEIELAPGTYQMWTFARIGVAAPQR